MELHFTGSEAVKSKKGHSRVWQRLAVSQTQVRNTGLLLQQSSTFSAQLISWLDRSLPGVRQKRRSSAAVSAFLGRHAPQRLVCYF